MKIARSGATCLIAAIAMVAAACGNDDASAPPPPTASATAQSTVEATLGATATSTAAPTIKTTNTPPSPATEEPTPESTPAQTPAPTVVPTATPSTTSEPTPEPTPTPDVGTTIEVEVAGGKPVDGVQRYRIDARDSVTIIVSGDTTDELHIHGYDLVVGFAPGRPGTITFEADIPGIFEVETHHHGDLVMELQVG